MDRSGGGSLSIGRRPLALAWALVIAVAVGVRLVVALTDARMWGYDAWGHVAYVFFLDLYGGVPWADQGWSYFHPPLHYALGWALAQFGSAEVLMRGLSLLGSAASLGTTALAAWVVARAAPERRGLSVLAFAALAFLPVHLFMGPMPGNELTLAFLSAASLCAFIANDRRAHPTLAGDAAAGALAGLALLTKFSGLLPVLVAVATLGIRACLAADLPRALARGVVRALVLAGVALALSAPYYARNLAEFDNPFELSRGYPLVAEVERDQRPGVRGIADYVRWPLGVFSDPSPRAPHMLGSVWGTAYANVWADIFRESDVERALTAHPSAAWMARLGLLPTLLALLGAGLVARDVWLGRRRGVYVALLVQAIVTLSVFAVFAWRVPIWSALKASYLLGLGLPYAAFVARSAEALSARRLGALTPAVVGCAALGAVWVAWPGAVLPRRADAPATAAVYFYFGETDAARTIYGRLVAGSAYPVPWLDGMAALAIVDDRPAEARRLYARAVEIEGARAADAYRRGQLAVATALDGDTAVALDLLDAALSTEPLPELRANRGALRLQLGDIEGGVTDLREALARQPELVPAWLNLALGERRAGREREAATAHASAEHAACQTPRSYPYGVGTGEVLEWGVGRRWLLLVSGDGIRPALPEFYRRACKELAR